MAEFHAVCTAFGDISKRLDDISRTSAKIVYRMQRCSAWYKKYPRLRKWWAAACLAITIFAALQILSAWSLSKKPRQIFQQPEDTKATDTASTLPTSHTPSSTRARQRQRNNDGLSSDQQLSRENSREIVTPTVTQLLPNMCGLHPHEVLWVCNTVSAWFSGVGWETLAWWWAWFSGVGWETLAWWWSYVGGPPIRGPQQDRGT